MRRLRQSIPTTIKVFGECVDLVGCNPYPPHAHVYDKWYVRVGELSWHFAVLGGHYALQRGQSAQYMSTVHTRKQVFY